MATSLSETGASREAPKRKVLDSVPCICYPVQFRKDKSKDVLALLDSGSKVNAMISAHVANLGLKMRVTDVDAQKIDGFSPATYGIVIATFQIMNKIGCSWFFHETFSLADISIEVVLGMLFLTLENDDAQFVEKELIWRTYTNKESFLTTRQVEIIDLKKFAKAALEENVEAFLVLISSRKSKMSIHPARKAQLALPLTKKVTVPIELLDFADVFSEKSPNVLPEQTGANEDALELEEGKNQSMG